MRKPFLSFLWSLTHNQVKKEKTTTTTTTHEAAVMPRRQIDKTLKMFTGERTNAARETGSKKKKNVN